MIQINGKKTGLPLEAIISTVICAGLLGYILNVARSAKNWGILWTMILQNWVLVVLLVIAYLICRFYIWASLLRDLDLKLPLIPVLTAFTVGEMTKGLPLGIYFQSFLFNRMKSNKNNEPKAYVATTAMLGFECAITAPLLIILGIPEMGWIRPTIVAIILFWIFVLFFAWQLVHGHFKVKNHNLIMKVKETAKEFLDRGIKLVKVKNIPLFLPTLIYIFVYSLSLYLITNSVGASGVNLKDTISIFAFFAAASVLVPIPTELGFVEFTGLQALIAYGVSGGTAALIMLGLRVLFSGGVILVGLIFLGLLALFSSFHKNTAKMQLTF